MATHSIILAWIIPWTEEPCGLVYGVAGSDTTENIPHIYLHKYIDTYTHTHMVLLVKIKNLWTSSYPEQVMINVSI